MAVLQKLYRAGVDCGREDRLEEEFETGFEIILGA